VHCPLLFRLKQNFTRQWRKSGAGSEEKQEGKESYDLLHNDERYAKE
jgi:hypothetical protein